MTSGPPWPVLLTIPNFVTAGSGKALVNLAERLDRTHFTPVVGVRRRGGTPLEARLAGAGIEVVELDLSPSARPYPTLPLRAWRGGRELRRRGIAVVHSFDYADSYTEALVARAAGARYVSTKKNMGWGSRAWLLRSLLSHRIAVQNEDMFRRFFHSRLLRGRCRYVPRGVVVDQFEVDREGAGARGALRSDLGIPDEAVVVASVASVQPRKNQVLLVEALPDRADVHLVLTGPILDEAYADRVRAAATDRGLADRLHLVGEVDDVRPTLAAADVFALASRAEGSPVALIEAMAAGLPIVATAIPGVNELLDGTGAATLVDPDDEAGAAAALSGLCDDPSLRAAGGRAARDLVRSRRSIDLEVARTESLYLELLWDRPGPADDRALRAGAGANRTPARRRPHGDVGAGPR